MARRPNLAAVDLKKEPGKAASKERPGMRAQTLRLPADYWFRLRVLAALRQTTMVELVQQALDEAFKKITPQERSALKMLP
jgi:hypothetical protein